MKNNRDHLNQKGNGTFVISLDFELYWGVHDVFSKNAYAANIYGGRQAAQAILNIFQEFGINATWAVVGMMNVHNMTELEDALPARIPGYANANLSPYVHTRKERISAAEYPLYFAPELIRKISRTMGQEIASHTFSHYYCLEKGQSLEAFKADARAFSRVMLPVTKEVKSVVFPRNQVNETYLSYCRALGLDAYRGNEEGWIYKITGNKRLNLVKRGLRFLDMYINLFGSQTYRLVRHGNGLPLNVRGSRQLKPVSQSLKRFETMRLKRILNAMTHAAKNGEIYHLWWHPHNFGVQLHENMMFLRQILEHYLALRNAYGFESMSMGEVAGKTMASPQRSEVKQTGNRSVKSQKYDPTAQTFQCKV